MTSCIFMKVPFDPTRDDARSGTTTIEPHGEQSQLGLPIAAPRARVQSEAQSEREGSSSTLGHQGAGVSSIEPMSLVRPDTPRSAGA